MRGSNMYGGRKSRHSVVSYESCPGSNNDLEEIREGQSEGGSSYYQRGSFQYAEIEGGGGEDDLEALNGRDNDKIRLTAIKNNDNERGYCCGGA